MRLTVAWSSAKLALPRFGGQVSRDYVSKKKIRIKIRIMGWICVRGSIFAG
jgi:hypothetical protein